MMGKGNCEFTGTGGQYFVTVFIHLFLISAVTFGIYSAWAWVRLFKLKASHTLINGKRVTFTGDGGQLLLLILVNGLLTLITLGIYGPWALCKFFDWRVRNTLVEGKRSQFTGTGSSLFLFYLIHLMLLPMLTLGIYYFLGLYRIYAWKEEHTRYGGEATSFGAGFGEFLKISLISWILNVVTLSLFTPWSFCMLYKWQIDGLAVGDGDGVKHFPPVKTNPVVAAILIIIVLTLFLALSLCIRHQDETRPREVSEPMRLPKMKQKGLTDRKGARALEKRPSGVVTPKAGREAVIKKVARQKTPVFTAPVPVKKPEQGSIDYDQEIKMLDGLIKRESKNADAFYNRGWLYAAKGNLEQALSNYTQAVQINRKFGDAYYNRGLLYVTMEKYELAVQDFDEAIKLDSRLADAYCNRGNANYRLLKNDLAIRDYTAALRVAPGDADVYYNRGVVYLSLGQKAEAMEDFKKAARLAHEKAKEYLTGEGEEQGGAESSSEKLPVEWKEDLSNVAIPETGAMGMINGEEFVAESVIIEHDILTIRDGEGIFPDHAVMIFLFLKEGQVAEGRSYHITKTSGFGSPHIHMKWKQENSELPKTEVFMKDYAMRLDLGMIVNGRLPGKIYICLPDEARSFVAGSFTALVK